jgi:glutamate racemase
LPYGEKSGEAICRYSLRIAELLANQGAKALVIACNSASAHAAEAVRKSLPHLPVIDVIGPAAAYVAGLPQPGKVGVIGTKATIGSGAFPLRLRSLRPGLRVSSLATPLLAGIIEEGYYNNNISQVIISEYLNHYLLRDLGTLVLACTHYPLIIPQIEHFYQSRKLRVDIVDTAKCVASALQSTLHQLGLAAMENAMPNHHFMVSDYTESFQESTRLFFGEGILLEHLPLWADDVLSEKGFRERIF